MRQLSFLASMMIPDRARLCAGFCALLMVTGCISQTGPDDGAAPLPLPQTPAPAPVEEADPAEVRPEAPYSLDGLSAHGLSAEAYLSGGRDPRTAWLLAATHLRHGVIDPHSGMARLQPDPEIVAAAEDWLPGQGPGRLDAFAPGSAAYQTLQTELARTSHPEQTASLQASLERLRQLPRPDGPRMILANIPGFEVITLENGRERARRPAIVGRPGRQTPEFSEVIEFIVFNPWWEVPGRIAAQDKLPLFRRDPSAVRRLGYQVLDRAGSTVNPDTIDWPGVSASDFPYRLRQAPGPHNALGQLKFMFPNAHDVYMHDTPDKDLFDRPQRAFSSGCIRVSDPVGLAEWVLSETSGWGRSQIEEAISSGRTSTALLATPLAIHLVYLTAFPNADGTIAYTGDIYGRDARLLGRLAPWLIASGQPASPAGPLAAARPIAILAPDAREISDNGNSLYCGG